MVEIKRKKTRLTGYNLELAKLISSGSLHYHKWTFFYWFFSLLLMSFSRGKKFRDHISLYTIFTGKNCQWRGDDGGVHCLVAGLSLHFCSSLCFWRVCGVSADVALETNRTAEASIYFFVKSQHS